MEYKIIATEDFRKQIKRLGKKYFSIPNDYENFINELLKNPNMGTDLGNNTRKVRMAITSKNKGKSGGARIITYQFLVDDTNAKIYLLTIYDKNEQENISEKEIKYLKETNGLI